MIQCSRKTFLMFVDIVFDVGVACVSFEYVPVMPKTYWFSSAVFGSGTSIFMTTELSKSAARRIWRCLLCLNLLSVLAQPMHLANVSYTLFALFGQNNLRRSVPKTLCWSGYLAVECWCARCKLRFCSEDSITIWVALSTDDLLVKNPRWFVWNSELGWQICTNFSLEYRSLAWSMKSSFSSGGELINSAKVAVSEIMPSLEALIIWTFVLQLSNVSTSRIGGSSLSGALSSSNVRRRNSASAAWCLMPAR